MVEGLNLEPSVQVVRNSNVQVDIHGSFALRIGNLHDRKVPVAFKLGFADIQHPYPLPHLIALLAL